MLPHLRAPGRWNWEREPEPYEINWFRVSVFLVLAGLSVAVYALAAVGVIALLAGWPG